MNLPAMAKDTMRPLTVAPLARSHPG